MKVSEAIEKLTMKRDDALKFQKLYNPSDVGWSANESKAISFNIAINTLEQIDEPQAEKVEVTEKQAELLRAFKGESLYELLASCLGEDEELMAKAKLFGYTVKPKRWVVSHEAGKFFEKFTGNGTSRAWVVWKNQAYIFTDRAKAEAVATLVEGSVEEV